MQIVWLQTSIWQNKLRTIYLLILLPAFTYLAFFLVNFIWWYNMSWSWDYINSFYITNSFMTLLWPIILIWWLISFYFHKKLILKFTWAKEVSQEQEPRVYNIVKQLCLKRWIILNRDLNHNKWIKIWIIEDESLNAFALWRKPENSRIVFSRWILNKLNDDEIEAVAAHEITHILNKDSLLMITIVIYIWIIATLWEILIRVRSKKSNQIQIIWLVLLLVWYLILPIVRLAISRKREFLADAWSVELTKNKHAMISALNKISQDSVIEKIEKTTVSAMCIANPFAKKNSRKSKFWNFFSTHPSIENRIEVLQKY